MRLQFGTLSPLFGIPCAKPPEIDYLEESRIFSDHNGVKNTAWPAIHSLDGSV